MRVEFSGDHSFVPFLIRLDGPVLDLGLNAGSFSTLIARRHAKVIGFEPDPVWNGCWNLPPNVVVIPKAVALRAGRVSFFSNKRSCSSLHFSDEGGERIEVEAISFADALAYVPVGRIDLVKIDIEGEEVPILEQVDAADLTRVAQISVEFHDFLAPASLPRIKAVIARLEGLGFYAFRFSWRSYGDMLFINRRVLPLSRIARLWMLFRYKYVRGTWRAIRRSIWVTPG